MYAGTFDKDMDLPPYLISILHPGRGFKFKMAKIILVALDMEFTSGCDDHLDEIHYIDSRANQYSVY